GGERIGFEDEQLHRFVGGLGPRRFFHRACEDARQIFVARIVAHGARFALVQVSRRPRSTCKTPRSRPQGPEGPEVVSRLFRICATCFTTSDSRKTLRPDMSIAALVSRKRRSSIASMSLVACGDLG